MPNSPDATQDLPHSTWKGFCPCLPVSCNGGCTSQAAPPEASLAVFYRVFNLAKERDLDLDFHVDENGNELATGLLHVAQKTIQHGYQGRVVCGHCWCAVPPCTSTALSDPDHHQSALWLMLAAAGIIRSLPAASSLCMQESLSACTAGGQGLLAAA